MKSSSVLNTSINEIDLYQIQVDILPYTLFQKRVVRTKFDIYVYITITGPITLQVDY